LSDSSKPPSPGAAGANTLVLRAVFVPEGQQPPPGFGVWPEPIRFSAEYDPEAGGFVTNATGGGLFAGLAGQWVPADDAGSGGEEGSDAKESKWGGER